MPDANKAHSGSAFDLNQARKGGKCVYLIEYDLIHDIERRGKTPWEVFKNLIKCGTILETVFDLDSAGTLEDEPSNQLMLEVLYATVLEPDCSEGLAGCAAGAGAADREERRRQNAGRAGVPAVAPKPAAAQPVPVCAAPARRARSRRQRPKPAAAAPGCRPARPPSG